LLNAVVTATNFANMVGDRLLAWIAQLNILGYKIAKNSRKFNGCLGDVMRQGLIELYAE